MTLLIYKLSEIIKNKNRKTHFQYLAKKGGACLAFKIKNKHFAHLVAEKKIQPINL